MEQLDYQQLKNLLKRYIEKYSKSITFSQRDLFDELYNKISTLEECSDKIVNLINYLTANSAISFNPETDILSFGSIKIKLNRADPNIPLQADNMTKAYPIGETGLSPDEGVEYSKKEKDLEKLTIVFYQVAFRVIKIAKQLPALEHFNCKEINIVRNKLIEHPEGKDSGVTFDSFAYSKNEGSFVKGLRKGEQKNFMDKGFLNNSLNFINNFEKVILEYINNPKPDVS